MHQLTIKLYMRYLRVSLLAAALALLAGCAATAGSVKSSKAENPFAGYSTDEILMSGDQAMRTSEYDRALFLYMQALEIEETAETWYRVGVTKIRLDDDIFAWRAFSQAIELDPEHAPSYEELGLLAMGFGRPEEANNLLNKAVELDNKRWRSYNALGVMADVDQHYAEAVVHYKAALEGSPKSAMLMNNIGYSYYLAGNLQEATFWFDEAIQTEANYKPAIKNLALLYAREGWYEDAVKTYRKVLPEAQAYNDTGYIAYRNGDLDEASRLLTKAIRLSPTYYALAYENLENVKEEMQRKSRDGNSADDADTLSGNNLSEIIFPESHEKKFRKVMPQVLNVRAEPSAEAEITNYLKTGNRVEVILSQPGWAFISFQTRSGGTVKGWVSTRFLETDSLTDKDAQARATDATP